MNREDGMARYRQGPYIVEEGYAMIDQDGQVAHQETFAETPAEASRLMWSILGGEADEGEMDTWSPGMAVLVTDTNLDYRSKLRRQTVVPYGVWEQYGDPYIF
ncbi:MAG: hypothetical protein M3R38_14535 [Actinomycetota bacterium]|nr:hypothetical protein [Actinomycetota bacterium]